MKELKNQWHNTLDGGSQTWFVVIFGKPNVRRQTFERIRANKMEPYLKIVQEDNETG